MDPHISDGLVDETAIDVALSQAGKQVARTIAKHMMDTPENYVDLLDPAPEDPALDALDSVVECIETGKDIRSKYKAIAGLVHGQAHRAELVASLVQTHDFSRMSKFLKARARVERVILAIAERGELTPDQSLALLDYIDGQLKASEKRLMITATDSKDLVGIIEKISLAISGNKLDFERQMGDTSARGREIIRKAAHHMLKVARAAPISTHES